MMICETKKLKNSEKFCLAFRLSPRYVDFQEIGCIRLKDFKAHKNAVGGAWGDDTWEAMVKDNWMLRPNLAYDDPLLIKSKTNIKK